jgi:hypothetical protein
VVPDQEDAVGAELVKQFNQSSNSLDIKQG